MRPNKMIQQSKIITQRKVKPWSQDWLIADGAYPGFCSMKRLEVFLLPLDGMLVHRRSLPRNLSGFPNNLPVPIYTPGWREALWELSVLPKNTTQWPRPGLKTRPLAPESSALTMMPPRLSQWRREHCTFCREGKVDFLVSIKINIIRISFAPRKKGECFLGSKPLR